jgi:hypothetical protein
MQVAFELRKQYEKFSGGTVALERGEVFDIGQALTDGGGVIVTDVPPVIDRLDNFPALKRTAVPDRTAKKAPKGSGDTAAATTTPDAA